MQFVTEQDVVEILVKNVSFSIPDAVPFHDNVRNSFSLEILINS